MTVSAHTWGRFFFPWFYKLLPNSIWSFAPSVFSSCRPSAIKWPPTARDAREYLVILLVFGSLTAIVILLWFTTEDAHPPPKAWQQTHTHTHTDTHTSICCQLVVCDPNLLSETLNCCLPRSCSCCQVVCYFCCFCCRCWLTCFPA